MSLGFSADRWQKVWCCLCSNRSSSHRSIYSSRSVWMADIKLRLDVIVSWICFFFMYLFPPFHHLGNSCAVIVGSHDGASYKTFASAWRRPEPGLAALAAGPSGQHTAASVSMPSKPFSPCQNDQNSHTLTTLIGFQGRMTTSLP